MATGWWPKRLHEWVYYAPNFVTWEQYRKNPRRYGGRA